MLRGGGPLTKPREPGPTRDLRTRAGRYAHWRVVAAVPAMIGSLLLMMLASGALSWWGGLLPLAWAACTAAAFTRIGERMTLRAACGFHRPSRAQAATLQPAWSTALRVTGTAADDVELYVQTARALNAYAAGRRSVAVTSQVVDHSRPAGCPRANW